MRKFSHIHRPSFINAILSGIFVSACTKGNTQPSENLKEPKTAALPTSADTPTPSAKAPQLDMAKVATEVQATMDLSVDPCQDFYQYACGGWLANTKRPPDKPRYGRGFGVVADQNRQILREILESASPSSGDGKTQKLGIHYVSCMDEKAIDKMGTKPLAPLLAKVDAIQDPGGFMEVLGEFHRSVFAGEFALFTMYVDADDKNPDTYVATFSQGGIGLPDRDFYLKKDAQSKALLQKYQQHIATMLELSGQDAKAAKSKAANIVRFETELAKRSRPRHELRDADKTYNKLGVVGLQALDQKLPWDRYFQGLGYSQEKFGPHVVVRVPDFYKGLGTLLAKTAGETLRDYLRWQLMHATAEHLTKEIAEANFAFERLLTGAEQLPPRWEHCTDLINFDLPQLVGPAFIERKFAGDSKNIALTMIQAIEKAFVASLPQLAWMDDETRRQAVQKAEAVHNKIGYPDRWRDYSQLSLKSGEYLNNVIATRSFDFAYWADRIGGEVNRDEWHMPPALVNAYYNPNLNEIVFPAGILQPPYFHYEFPMAMNFGGIGMVMGHELTHGFDDQGRKFDGGGVLHEWWSEQVSGNFDQQAQCIDQLYSNIEALPGVRLNGKLTLGENIADFGGIKQAYLAYQNWARTQGTEQPSPIEDLTNQQLFFISFAQGWCTHASDEDIRTRAMTDSHSPPKQRVNVPLAHLPGFWEAFSCEEGTPMHPKNVCSVW